jgi:hypothetical protein
MLIVAFVLAIWPFHRKPETQAQPTITIGPQLQPGELFVPENLCEHDDAFGWSLSGPDGETGYSPESCQKAFENWKDLPVNRIEMKRL